MSKIKHPKETWKWYGNAGHLCVSNWCRFHLTTLVGDYVISTVGEYFPPHATERDCPQKPAPIGSGEDSIYETMTFKWTGNTCECGCGLPNIDGSELECKRYKTAKEATIEHYKTCEKYSKS